MSEGRGCYAPALTVSIEFSYWAVRVILAVCLTTLLWKKPLAISAAPASIRNDHPLPVLSRLFVTGVGNRSPTRPTARWMLLCPDRRPEASGCAAYLDRDLPSRSLSLRKFIDNF